MGFVKKTWKDRLVEYAGRRKLTNVATGATQTVDVTRVEGTESQAGDMFNATNMNDLENRTYNAFNDVVKVIKTQVWQHLHGEHIRQRWTMRQLLLQKGIHIKPI